MRAVAAEALAGHPGKQMTRGAPAAGEECLVHDGEQVIARHGPGAITVSGNPAHRVVVGSRKELDAESRMLGAPEDGSKPSRTGARLMVLDGLRLEHAADSALPGQDGHTVLSIETADSKRAAKVAAVAAIKALVPTVERAEPEPIKPGKDDIIVGDQNPRTRNALTELPE